MSETTKTFRVVQYQADAALELLPIARTNADTAVINACLRIHRGWLRGERVMVADRVLVDAFRD